MVKIQYLSAEGLKKLQDELKYLKTTKRKEVSFRIETAKELGDLSENAEYADAKEEQGWVEGRIRELGDILQNAAVIESGKQTGYVNVGSTIRVKVNGKEKTFQVVGSNEADPGAGKISNESPLGQAFLGKKAGDNVEITVPAGKVIYTILEIK
jgi:transcription elongation factor GreA